MQIEMRYGEVLDRLSILHIKCGYLTGVKKVQVESEIAAITALLAGGYEKDMEELERINDLLWIVQDQQRKMDRDGNFGSGFVELSKSIYQLNDLRIKEKSRLNQKMGEAPEIKIY